MRGPWRPSALVLGVMLVATVAVPGAVGSATAVAADTVDLRVVSNRADLVSDGNALIEVVPPAATAAESLRVEVDGRDVTDTFVALPDGRRLGVVDGLRPGANTVTARTSTAGGRLVVTNYPRTGPVFSGPHISPWRCAEGAADEHCNRPTVYAFFYKSTNPARSGFQDYDPANPPSDVATTTTDQGRTVPYIVRQETGVIARDEYRIAVLFDPEQEWSATAPQQAFNHKLLINHGASCDTAYEQGSAPDVLNDTALSRGFIVMSHALNNSGHNCNIVTQAEAMIMTKEHLIDTYGELRYTIGTGCSGGAQVQQQVANAYPGFYQGITPACSFPDSWSGKMLYEDYSLLRAYFENPARWRPGVVWTEEDVANTWGHPSHVNAITYNTVIARTLDPSRPCPGLEEDEVYEPETNPTGVRCSQQDYMVNLFGRRPGDGFANRPHDSVGTEYGRNALMAGEITPAQFVDVNAKVGGRDIDYNPTPERAVADLPAMDVVYRSGAVNMANNLDQVAIIDLRGPDPGAFHDVYRTYALRARMERELGHTDNHVMWRGTVPLFGDVTFAADAILAVDEWLTAVEADRSDLAFSDKLVKHRPESARDRCTDGAGHDYDNERLCNTIVESYSTARIEAGMPFTDDVLKCQLKPFTRTDYLPVRFTDEEWATLQGVFPDGVCDYSKPGVGQQDTVPWMGYADGPGGKPLGPPPTATAVAGAGAAGNGGAGASASGTSNRPAASLAATGSSLSLPLAAAALLVLAWVVRRMPGYAAVQGDPAAARSRHRHEGLPLPVRSRGRGAR